MKHSKFSASGSSRWIACPASIKMSESYPKQESGQAAQEGTAMHAMAEECQLQNVPASDYLGERFEGIKMTEEFCDLVQEYLDYIDKVKKSHSIIKSSGIEIQVPYTNWIPEGFGTIDRAIISKNIIDIIDLKTGRGRVNAKENTQGMLYALGIYQFFNFPKDIKTINIHIVQPRIDNFDCWSIDIKDLLLFAETARHRALNALSDEPEFGPSESACQWCVANDSCKPFAEFNLAQIDMTFEDLDKIESIEDFQPGDRIITEDIAKILKVKPIFEKWLTSIENYAKNLILEGQEIEGFKVVEKRTHAKWINEQAPIDLLADKAYVKKLVSPAQAKKLIDIDLSDFIMKPKGDPVVAPESDKRDNYIEFEEVK